MKLDKEQLEFTINNAQAKFIKRQETIDIRKNHEHPGSFVEVHAETATSCGDQRVEVFGVCTECKEQLYHWQHIKIMQMLYPIEWLDE